MLNKHHARALKFRYYALMLSSAVVAAVLGAIAAYTVGSLALLPKLLGWMVLFLFAVNMAGAAFLYHPVQRQLDVAAGSRDGFESTIRRLPLRSGLWVGCLAGIAMLVHAIAVHGSWQAMTGGSPRTLASMLVHITVFAIYLGLYAHLLTLGFIVHLRRQLWKQGEALSAHGGRFAVRLVVVVIAVALGPVLVILADQWNRPLTSSSAMDPDRMSMEGMRQRMMSDASMHAMGAMHERYMTQSRQMDLLASLLLAGLLAYLATRGLSRSAETLLQAMDQVDTGDLATKAPVLTDDEFGRLAERFNGMLDGLNDRERLRRTFERFVPETIAAALIADEGAIAPQEREATVLFTDIERFTQIASHLAPREVMTLLNAYFGEVAHIIHRHRGVITQFQGDAVLASFNLPLDDSEHARNALDAALEIVSRMTHARFGVDTELRTRIGISTGLVVGGTVGSGTRLGYTVHGDTVNLAARLESLNKDLGTTILVSGRTAEMVGDSIPLRNVGLVNLRGFDVPVPVFEPCSHTQSE